VKEKFWAGRKEWRRRKSCGQEERNGGEGKVMGRKRKKGNVAEGRFLNRKNEDRAGKSGNY